MVNLFSELDDSPNYEREREREKCGGGGDEWTTRGNICIPEIF